MWKIVPIRFLLVWCVAAIHAFYDGFADDWNSSDDELNKLQKLVTPEEAWRCAVGPVKKLQDCNHCVCLGGQMYLCTAKRCEIPNHRGVMVKQSYREKPREICIEGEKIKSFNCNRCWCSGGKILCTIRMCRTPKRTNPDREMLAATGRLLLENEPCKPGSAQPSRDNCNTCGCNRRGEQYCTAMTCGNTVKPLTHWDIGCEPGTWYSLATEDATCKECFCIDGRKGLCYMKLCQGTLAVSPGYTPLKLMAGASSKSTCKKGELRIDKCTKCQCTYAREWRCYTRMIDKCEGPEKKSQRRDNSKQVPSNPENSDSAESVEIDNLLKLKPKTSTEGNSGVPDNPKMPENKGNEEDAANQDDNDDDEIPSHTTENLLDQSKSQEFHNNPSPKNSTKTEEPITKKINKPRKSTTKPPRRPRRPGDLLEGTECNSGESFTQGASNNCQGCFCTEHGKWKCFSVKKSCRGWVGGDCEVGAYAKNQNIACSVCFCAQDEKWICFTDEACAQQIKRTGCDAEDCAKKCVHNNNNYGFCHRDQCTCV